MILYVSSDGVTGAALTSQIIKLIEDVPITKNIQTSSMRKLNLVPTFTNPRSDDVPEDTYNKLQ